MSISQNDMQSKTKSFPILKILFASIVGISLLYSTQFILTPDQFRFISTPSYVVIPGALAALSCFVAMREWKNNSENKLAIVFFTVGVTSWFIAEQLWLILELVFHEDPFPSFADIFYIIGYPFFIAFLILYIKPLKQHITKNVFLFSIVISIAFLLPSFYVIADYYQEEPPLDITVALVYPTLGSFLLFTTLLGIAFFFKGNNTHFWTLVFIGFLIDTITDTLFLFSAIDESYHDGQVTDLLYLIGYLFYAAGIMSYFRTKPTKRSDMHVITFEIIGKFVIPLIIGAVFVTTSMLLIYSYSYGESFTGDSFFTPVLIGIFVIIGIFASSIVIINKNIDTFIRQKTKELQIQKQDLEILLDKKSEELINSSEFSNLGVTFSQIVHDLRSPLTVLNINMEMIEKDIENPVILKRIERMRESINLIDAQISDVLNYVKKPTINIVEANLLELIQQAIHNIDVPKEVTVNLPPKDITISCDPVRMVLVFINILTNAIDAMNKQGTITINATKNAYSLTIDLVNSGPSIPEDIMEKIFEPLFTTKPTGTGLGLATCKRIIQQHNGTISVRNNPTAITIEIPTVLF